MFVLDLKIQGRICNPPLRFSHEGSTHVYRLACVHPSYGLHAAEDLPALRGEVPRQFQRQAFHLSRSVPDHVFCPVDVSRKFERHRSLPPGTKQQTLSHGHPQQGFPQHTGRGKRDAGLAHLCGFCPSSDRCCQKALPERTIGRGTQERCLRFGCHDNRPVPVNLSLGALPENKGCRPSSHLAGFTGQHSDLYPHLRRQTPRSQHPGSNPSGSRSFLHYGSWFPRFFQATYRYLRFRVLCDPRQIESEVPQALFPSSRQINGHRVRSIDPADRTKVGRGLSRQAQTSKISRRRNQQNFGVSIQQLPVACHHHRPALQTTLAGGTLFQMDQTESTYQELLRHFRERRKDSDLDSNFRLPDRGYNKKTAEFTGESLHNFTGFERLSI